MVRNDARLSNRYDARISSTDEYGNSIPLRAASANFNSGSNVPSMCRCSSHLGSPAMKSRMPHIGRFLLVRTMPDEQSTPPPHTHTRTRVPTSTPRPLTAPDHTHGHASIPDAWIDLVEIVPQGRSARVRGSIEIGTEVDSVLPCRPFEVFAAEETLPAYRTAAIAAGHEIRGGTRGLTTRRRPGCPPLGDRTANPGRTVRRGTYAAGAMRTMPLMMRSMASPPRGSVRL